MDVIDLDTPIGRLLNAPLRAGEVAWIGLRPAKKAAVQVVPSATLVAARGIEGDHQSRPNPRQVTLISEEDIAAIASFLGQPVTPEHLRRNIMVRGVNLNALKDRRFRVGQALLEYTGPCNPCGLIEKTLGEGGYNATRGRAGITARITLGGAVSVGDPVVRV